MVSAVSWNDVVRAILYFELDFKIVFQDHKILRFFSKLLLLEYCFSQENVGYLSYTDGVEIFTPGQEVKLCW